MKSKVEVRARGVLAEAADSLADISVSLEGVADALFYIAVELSRLNEQLEAFFKEMREKGVMTRAV